MRTDPAQPVFRALADPTRRAIVSMLANGPRAIGDIAVEFEMTRPAVAKHLAILKEGGVIAVETKGRERINRLNPDALKTAADWLNHFDRFWDDRLAKLKEVVEKTS
jgi:DNA-binding transcriptional ArsR family regulator